MKNFKFTKQLFAAALVAIVGFSSCQKNEMDEVSPLSSNRTVNAEELNDEKLAITVNSNPSVVGDLITIIASKEGNDAGEFYLQEKVNGTWVSLDVTTLTISSAALSDNGREFRTFYDKEKGNDFYSTSVTLIVTASCEDWSLNVNSSEVSHDEDVYTVSTTYVLSTCDRAVNGIKLQGGLTSGAEYVSGSTGVESKITGKGKGNTVLSFNVGNMGANESKTFTITYKKTIACGTTEVVTGAWSAKGKYADDNSAAVAGYDNNQEHTSVDCE